ncbi:MAG: hypothetical protein WCK02_15840 [Bacteroidota bacterium]
MKKTLLLFAAIFIGYIANAQMGGGAQPMAALNSGDIKSLDGVKKLNIIYDFTELGVGAFRKEQDYIDKKYKEYEEKEKGKGDKFKEAWFAARKKTYEPVFELMFNKYAAKDIMMSGTNYATDNEYTLVVKTVFIEPGMNIGIAAKPAFIDLECTFKDKSGAVLCVFYLKNAIGQQAMGFDYDVSSRLKESYAKSAKMLIGIIAKERKKAAKKK